MKFFSSSANSLKIHPILVRMRQYRYNPLFQKGHAIRVLQLLPSRDQSSVLRGKLIEYLFEDIDATNHVLEVYEALSYVWGGEEKPKSIIITDDQNNEHQEVDSNLPITQSLYNALMRLRHCKLPRFLWVDAVCIDQTNDEEKEHQIQLMPVIYARARCVLVWLGEAQDDSDMVLESIQAAPHSLQLHCDHPPPDQPQEPRLTEDTLSEAREMEAAESTHKRQALPGQANGDLQCSVCVDHLRQGIQKLLNRPWFRRMWILQEIGAARHVAILCGSTEIDGHAFSLGLDSFMKTWETPLCSVTFLMRNAIFRPRRLLKKQKRFSLDICSLSELIDQYHIHESTIPHDKLYALLGMSSDDISAAGLEPDYKLAWEELMERLVRFLLGNRVSIYIAENPDIAVIKGKGCILGLVSSIKTTQGRETEVNFDPGFYWNILERVHNQSISWSLPSLPRPIKRGDLLCLLEGAQKPIIIRPYEGHFAVVMIGAVPRGQSRKVLPDAIRSTKWFDRDLLLTWNWGNSLVESQDTPACELTRSSNKSELARHLNDFTSLWNVALALKDFEEHRERNEMLEKATKLCKYILKMMNLHISSENLSGLTPLAFAAKNGHAELASMLIAEDKNILVLEDMEGQTPLSHAARQGNLALVKLLLDSYQPRVIAADFFIQNPLSWAAMYGHEDIVQLLLKANQINVNTKDDRSSVPLLQAVRYGKEGVVKLLLEADQFDVNAKDERGETPLSLAIRSGEESIVQLLLKTGQIDLNTAVGFHGLPPLIYAVLFEREDLLKTLLDKKADVDSRDRHDRTPLSFAAENGFEVVVKMLLDNKADVDSRDQARRTPLSYAAERGHEAVVKMLLDNKADVASRDQACRTPLSYAERGHEAVTKILLENKFDVYSLDWEHRMPLTFTVGKGHEAIIKLLREVDIDRL